jgi:hypothetical protein
VSKELLAEVVPGLLKIWVDVLEVAEAHVFELGFDILPECIQLLLVLADMQSYVPLLCLVCDVGVAD